ncbi:MAG: glutaminyl-peptide cyclotransferase [Prevotellaceae bacterium]|jgi:glutaminyl-peptide cyclotransferase|nr:glutaminyl-peptide cyclotransferase [Prevotellaceae bacterium]
MLKVLLLSFCLVICVSCLNRTETRTTQKTKSAKKELFVLSAPKNGATFKSGDVLTLNIKNMTDSIKMDSCVLNIDGKYRKTFDSLQQEFPLSSVKMGIRRMSLVIYSLGKTVETIQFALKIIPASAPQLYKYKVVREYPHDDKAYTQGLFYSEGFLFEGTGQEKHSSLRKVELETGRVLIRHLLPDKYFGEGICLHRNQIYQLTWKNREGFIYSYPDCVQTGKFDYNSEGWGITGDGENLWMSDGTSNLYKLNPGNMNIIDQLEVYSNKGAETNLNELEYINGEIWANVYAENYIVRINPETGEITGKINLNGILKREYIKPDTDVLNGIAYDAAKNRIFVTGKNWAKLFEIEIMNDE